jgi:hypothetical protein
MFKFLKYKLAAELEQLRSKHRIEIDELVSQHERVMKDKDAQMEREFANRKHELELQHKEIVTLLKLDSEQKQKQVELDFKRLLDEKRHELQQEFTDLKEKLIKENYDKLGTELAKLHSEGNQNTKFVQDLAISMLGNVPESKTQVKVISRGEKENK